MGDLITKNKKVYISNYWWTNNYGAILTAYSLQQILNKNNILTELFNTLDNYLYYKLMKNFKQFKDFENNYLTVINPLIKNFRDLFGTNKQGDLYIVGSDQVFRMQHDDALYEQYILSFADINTKKIAFSASFGVAKDEFLKETSEKNISKMKNALKSFDFISVREKSGMEICEDVLGVEAEWIIDPVFILEKSKYNELIKNASGKILKQVQNDTIVSYVLDTNKEYKKAYKYLSGKYGGEVVETANSNISVESWLKSIRDCKLFVTDSFHGMCFAIIFNKPFICISNKSRGAARFESICEMLGIENQCITSIDEIYERDCVFKVDWDGVNEKINYERQRGLEFLKKALDAPCGKFEEKQAVRTKYLEDRVCELEEQANLNYQIKKELWNLWLVIWHKYLPNPIKCIIRNLRGKKNVRK